jgi:hypothetical protein
MREDYFELLINCTDCLSSQKAKESSYMSSFFFNSQIKHCVEICLGCWTTWKPAPALMFFLKVCSRPLIPHNGREIHADLNISRVVLLFKKDLNHDSYFLRSCTQIKSPNIKPFSGSSRLHRSQLKNRRRFKNFPT